MDRFMIFFLEVIYSNLSYEYTKKEWVPKSIILKYLKEIIHFFGCTNNFV